MCNIVIRADKPMPLKGQPDSVLEMYFQMKFNICWSNIRFFEINPSHLRRVKKWVKFAFSSFWSCRTFKIPHFCQKMCLSRFSPCGKVTVSVLSKSLIFVKRCVWLVFYQTGSSQNERSLSLQEKGSKSCLWASNTLVQKPCSFNFFSRKSVVLSSISTF